MIEWSSTMIIYIMKYTHVNGGLMTIMILFEWRMMGLLKMKGFYFFPAPSKTKTGLETEDILKRPTNRRSKIEDRSTERHSGVDDLAGIAQADAHDVWTFDDLRFYTQKPCQNDLPMKKTRDAACESLSTGGWNSCDFPSSIFHFMKNINANRFSQSGFSEVQFNNSLINPCPCFAAQKSSKIYSFEKHL